MKTLIAFAFLIVGISAGPNLILEKLNRADSQNERIIEGPIANMIEDLSQQIRDAGLDPLDIKQESLAYALPVEVLLNIQGGIQDFLLTGLSNIQINYLNFGILTTRLTFDLELPQIALSLRNAEMNVEIFGAEYNSRASGSLAIESIRVTGNVRVRIGLITGISIADVNIHLAIGGIKSDLTIVLANMDLSSDVNKMLGETIPATLEAFSQEMNELLEIIIEQVASDIFN